MPAATCSKPGVKDCSSCRCPVERDGSKQAVSCSPTIGVDHPLKKRREEEETGTSTGHQEPGRGAPRVRKLFLDGDDPAGVDGGEGGGEEEAVGEVEGGEGRCGSWLHRCIGKGSNDQRGLSMKSLDISVIGT